tara:strand:+ start:2107 stop:2958 length:852 start_codon:yes stop_codon:yes gene_type:complete
MNILITGCTGFIGSNILTKFQNSNKIYIILRNKKNNKKFKNKNIKIINYKNYDELNKKISKIKAELIIHTATHYAKIHNQKDLKEFSDSNILFGNIILENLKSMKTKKFINFSTVWEDYNGIKENYFNLYSAYKKAFSKILNFYRNKFKKVKFYELMISDTFGKNDNRLKIINVLRKNYKSNTKTKIISKNLYVNFLNVEDITNAVYLIYKKNIKPSKYLLKNNSDTNIHKMIQIFNKENDRKIKVKWLSNKLIKEKSLPYKKLKSWKPIKSNISDIIKIIKN